MKKTRTLYTCCSDLEIPTFTTKSAGATPHAHESDLGDEEDEDCISDLSRTDLQNGIYLPTVLHFPRDYNSF